jgi:hypothetical protein
LKHVILIPVYNDWKSLNKLLIEIDKSLKDDSSFTTQILVINDLSTEKCNLNIKNFSSIKKIEIINLKKNLGSQKSIAVGLNYLKKIKDNFFITVMDGDGEDNPYEIKKMLNEAIKYESFVITSNRKKRRESMLVVLLYRIHLIISFLFTFKWISFGNFTTFNSKNLEKLLSNNSSWYAHSSSVLKNCRIKRLYAKREKRYFDKSKLNMFALMEHSLRVNAVFLPKIFINSLIYSSIIFWAARNFNLDYLIIFLILIFNILLFFIRRKHYIRDLLNSDNLIDNIKLL